ncbi:MAG TPA: hypothetical protein H9903_16515 [Candidatus Aquabacterium excrementipullorum]|nr:hypothetical protein [Candidatus Aquabacterium excrementipullorum]
MKRLPARPDLGHLKKQAKALLSQYRDGEPAAMARFRAFLPAAAGQSDLAITQMALRLHDAQSCLAREYGFVSWADLQGFVSARRAHADDPAKTVFNWLRLVYAGDVAGGTDNARPTVAERLLQEHPGLLGDDPYLACAVGDEALLRRTIEHDPSWVHRAGGPLQLPPLVAVTQSGLARLPAYRDGLRACTKLLLDAGADPNQSVGNRWPPASLAQPSATERLSALYGAAGRSHDAVITKLLLDAGADPDDGESLYHALDSDNTACLQLLLEAGARIAGTNALFRVLDRDDIEALRLLLSHGADPNEVTGDPYLVAWQTPLLWGIRRRRSVAHIEALLAAGANPRAQTGDGTSAHLLALRFGLTDVARLLAPAHDEGQPLPVGEDFIAACARCDEPAARALLSAHPGLISELTAPQLSLMSELASQGCDAAVRLMVELGWPIAAKGGDWDASALNQAVFRGDAPLARFLLAHGAQWTEEHAYGSNLLGSLSWGSCNEPHPGGDWLGCAQALVEHGLPTARPDPVDASTVLVDGVRMRFSDEVADYLLSAGAPS